MKATDGTLRLDQSYKYIRCEYNGKHMPDEFALPTTCCENCGKPISNVATVKGSVDGREYHIGLDCASTLTGITPDEIAQAQKQMRNEAKFRKWITTEMESWTEYDGIIYLFGFDLSEMSREASFVTCRYQYRCNANKYANQLPVDKQRIIINQWAENYQYMDGTYLVFQFGKA